MSLSRKDLDDLRPSIDRMVQKFLGFSEPTLVTAALNCVDKGYDRRKTVDKMATILDDTQAGKFTDKLFACLDDYKTSSRHSRSRKRKEEREESSSEGRLEAADAKRPKKAEENAPVPEPGQPSPGQLTADKIKEMMANAQKMIQQRKVELNIHTPLPPDPTPSSQLYMSSAVEKAKKAAELQARIQAQLMNTGLALGGAAKYPGNVPGIAVPGLGVPGLAVPGLGLPGMPSSQLQSVNKVGAQQSMPTPLILDDQGRTIDAKTGETIQLSHHMPTLKANIRAKKREQFKAELQQRPPEEITESKFFDTRVGQRQAVRGKRNFIFHEKGKFEQIAARLRTKAQLDKLQNEIAQAAKKTGIASAAKLAVIQPKNQTLDDGIPEVEWWDSYILTTDSYYDISENESLQIYLEGITRLVEHPVQMKSPGDSEKKVEIPVMLTKKERKKLRRQNRTESQKELQEKVRMGLMPPPEPKVRLANLMRVLGTEAVQDPTKIEAHVRAQMAKRQRQHEESNATRKLTAEQRSEKKARKLKEDTSLGVNIAVYRVRDLKNASRKFKIEANCKQLFMTGFVVIYKDCNVVVVEGGPKQQKKFKRLMLNRIKWAEDKKSKDEDADSDDEEKKENSCTLVWEGTSPQRAFGDIIFKTCPTENFAREQFRKHGVEQYWDLAFSQSVLEATGEDLV